MNWTQPWYIALASENGFKMRVNNHKLARAKLYLARAAAHDPALATLALVVPRPGEIWIVKRDAPKKANRRP